LRFTRTSSIRGGNANATLRDRPADSSNSLNGRVSLDLEADGRAKFGGDSGTDNRPETSPSLWRDEAAPSKRLHQAPPPVTQKELALGREEQVALARKLRPSVILDAADEAIYKIGRLANEKPKAQTDSPTTMSTCPTMEHDSETHYSTAQTEGTPDAFSDSFRWLEEDEDLDLSLHLDDYHANLREALPLPKRDRRPSFRRHLSITKLPFGRSSISLSRPPAKDAVTMPTRSPTPSDQRPQHFRRKSRALSLITPRQTRHVSTPSIDQAATHYQDPEARHKLRSYLASPTKFDEAIEFGFPSNEMMQPRADSQPPRTQHGHTRNLLSNDSEKFKTFFADDRSSTSSDDVSLGDPESPRTPRADLEKQGVSCPTPLDESSHPAQRAQSLISASAETREMTLRMTLTRPDLRAEDDQIYGWQRGGRPATHQGLSQFGPSQTAPRHDLLPADAVDNSTNEGPEKLFTNLNDREALSELGVVKRIWHRVRRA
jgi:hypothetical protein